MNLIDTFKSLHQHSYTKLLAFNISSPKKEQKRRKIEEKKKKRNPSTPSSASIRLLLQHRYLTRLPKTKNKSFPSKQPKKKTHFEEDKSTRRSFFLSKKGYAKRGVEDVKDKVTC